MKISFFRLAILMAAIITTLIFSACQQEQALELPSTVAESPNSMIENRGSAEPTCGTEFSKEQIDYLKETSDARRNFSRDMKKNATRYVPIINHIVRRTNGTGGLSIGVLNAALNELNAAYEAANIQFYECQPPKYINSNALYDFNPITEEGTLTMNEVADVLNIYHTDRVAIPGTEICGYSYTPPSSDRVVMNNSCISNGSTLIHEVGHYFSLIHTHGPGSCTVPTSTNELVDYSNCSTAGDLLCDTPADPCLSGLVDNDIDCMYTGNAVDANGDAYQPATDNFMSYSRKACRVNFTNEQLNSMAFSVAHDRDNLLCNAVSSQITWSFVDTRRFDYFRICATPYEGTTHQFSYQTAAPGGAPLGGWVFMGSTTAECFNLSANSCYYNVRVRIRAENGDWGSWSLPKYITCLSISP